MKNKIYLALGFFFTGLGAVGAALPLLPTVPLLLLAAYFFARSSKRFNDWFRSTKLYKNNLEVYLQTGGLPIKKKFRIMAIVTAQLALGFLLMKSTPIGRTILCIVWGGLMLFFLFGIKTIQE